MPAKPLDKWAPSGGAWGLPFSIQPAVAAKRYAGNEKIGSDFAHLHGGASSPAREGARDSAGLLS